MCYRNNDQQQNRKKLLPARLRSFFNIKEEEKLQDYNMVRRSAVSKTKHKLRIFYAKLSFYFMFLNIRRFSNVFFLFCILHFLLPCSLCGFEQDETISHYFTITVNMQKTVFWTPRLFNCISRHNRILQQCNQQINENLEAHKHRATTFRKKHRPLQKGQTAGATSRRRHVSTSNIFTYFFFVNARFNTTITEIILFFCLFNTTITTTIAQTFLFFPFLECNNLTSDGTIAATVMEQQQP